MCMNLHCHDIEIYIYNGNEKEYKQLFKLEKFGKSNKLDKNSKYLFFLSCPKCKIFENENENEIHDIIKFGEKTIIGSCFQTENGSWSISKKKVPNFFEFNDTLLIGDKEIISFINEEKNNNTKLNSTISSLENSLKEKNNKITELSKKNQSLKDSLKEKENEINNLSSKIKSLEKSLKEKENEINKLFTKNKSLEKSVAQSNNDIKIKDSQIEKIKNSLSIEKNNNQNIEKDLRTQKEKNNALQSKLENISSVNNENVQKVLDQVQSEKIKNKNLESKISELKEKEKELEDIKKKNPKNIGLKFESDCEIGEYDVVLDITSFKDLVNGGWKVKYKDGIRDNYLKKKEENQIILGVIGNGNKGKSFFLEKLSGYQIPQGFNIKTEGLSIRYGANKDHIIAILDSAGQETPLLKMDKDYKNDDDNVTPNSEESQQIDANDKTEKNEEKKNSNETNGKIIKEDININNSHKKQEKDEKTSEVEENEFEKYSRDKLITEYFIQRFIIWKSDILILVVGNITLTEQKLLARVKTEINKIKNKIDKRIYIIHNLKDFTTDEQVNDYIENTLKKLYKIEINENIYQNIRKKEVENENIYFDKYFTEKGNKVSHFIFINQYSNRAEYYNIPTIKYIQGVLENSQERNPFPIIEDCKEFLIKISEEIIENESTPKIENLITKEEEKEDRIILKGCKEIVLKKFVIDEMGYALNDMNNEPKYSYYINTEDKMFYVNIELPGGGSILDKIEIAGPNYYFIYEGTKNGDAVIENDKKSESKKLLKVKNLRKNNNFKIVIQVPCSDMQILTDFEEGGEFSDGGKGVYTFKYKIKILSDKKEKKPKKPNIC